MIVVPTINLDQHPHVVGSEVDVACQTAGFFQVVGHGISTEVADAAWASATAFFDLPIEERMTVAAPAPSYPYGYSPLAAETLARSADNVTPPDLKEIFNIGPIDPPPHQLTDADEAWQYSPNLWPDKVLPRMRPTWEIYYREMLALSEKLMSFFARGLSLPPDFFADKINKSPSAMRAINYPDQRTKPAPGQLRASAHTDYGTLTILSHDDAPGGLEIFDNRSRAWLPLDYVPGAFVVNIGDLMARWTNDRWRSTLHRVANPPSGAQGKARRQSMAFFHNANYDCLVQCLPSCLPNHEPPKYNPVIAGPYLMAKFKKSVAQ